MKLLQCSRFNVLTTSNSNYGKKYVFLANLQYILARAIKCIKVG